MTKSLTKRDIISELASRTEQTQKVVESVLNELTDLIYREAANDFTLPGLCKFKVARRKQSKRFNVATGRHYIVAAHDVLKIVPLKKAKMMIAPPPADLFVTELPVEPRPTAQEQSPIQETALSEQADPVPAPPPFSAIGGIGWGIRASRRGNACRTFTRRTCCACQTSIGSRHAAGAGSRAGCCRA